MNWLTKARRNWRTHRRISGWMSVFSKGKSASIGIDLSSRFNECGVDEGEGEAWQDALINAIHELGAVPVYIWAGLNLDSPLVLQLSRLAFRLDCSVHLIGQGPKLDNEQIENIVLSGVESFACAIAAVDPEIHRLAASGNPHELVSCAQNMKQIGRTLNRNVQIIARIPWHQSTFKVAMNTLDWLNSQGFDEVVIVPPFYGSDLAHSDEVLALLKQYSHKHQTSASTLKFLSVKQRSERLPGVLRTAGSCQVARQVRLIRPNGDDAHCPFKLASSGPHELFGHLNAIKKCERHCHHPDILPLNE